MKRLVLLVWMIAWGIIALPGAAWVTVCILIGHGPKEAKQWIKDAGIWTW